MATIDIDQLLAATEEIADDCIHIDTFDIDRLLDLTDNLYKA